MHGTTAHRIMAPKITIDNEERHKFQQYCIMCASVKLLNVYISTQYQIQKNRHDIIYFTERGAKFLCIKALMIATNQRHNTLRILQTMQSG